MPDWMLQTRRKNITGWSPFSKYNSSINKIPPTTLAPSPYFPFFPHPVFLVNTVSLLPIWEQYGFDTNTNTSDICHNCVRVSSIQLNKKMKIPLKLTLPTPQLVSPPSVWSISLHGSYSPRFLLFSSFNSFLFSPECIRYLLLFPLFCNMIFFVHYLLDWFSLQALLIWLLFRSISPNQYLISERSTGLLLYELRRIVNTHQPPSLFNLFTPKVMKYWIGLRYMKAPPILYHPHLVHVGQNSGPAIKQLITSGDSFFFIYFSSQDNASFKLAEPSTHSSARRQPAYLTYCHVFCMISEPSASHLTTLKAYISNHVCFERPSLK